MGDERSVSGSVTGTRAEIIDFLRRGPATPTEIAKHLGFTYNAVRMHLVSLVRDGLLRPVGVRRGGTRPSMLYEVTPALDDLLSRAYTPFLSNLVRALSERLPETQLDEIMRTVGRDLAEEWPRPRGTLTKRIEAASSVLAELGAPNEVTRTNGTVRIRGFGCLLATAVQGRPHVCRAMEALLERLLEAPVRECCERGERPRCCFDITIT